MKLHITKPTSLYYRKNIIRFIQLDIEYQKFDRLIIYKDTRL